MVILLAAVFCDLKTWKIRNECIFFGVAMGIYYMILEQSYISSLFGMLLPIFLLWPLFYIRALGAGDIKLFSVLGIFYGYQKIVSFIIVAFIIAAIISIIHIIKSNNLKVRMQYFICYISNVITTKKISNYYCKQQDGTSPVIHFSIAIVMSYLFSVIQIY